MVVLSYCAKVTAIEILLLESHGPLKEWVPENVRNLFDCFAMFFQCAERINFIWADEINVFIPPINLSIVLESESVGLRSNEQPRSVGLMI